MLTTFYFSLRLTFKSRHLIDTLGSSLKYVQLNKPKYEFTSTDQNRTQNNYKPLLANNMPFILELMVSKLGEKDGYLPLRRKKTMQSYLPCDQAFN